MKKILFAIIALFAFAFAATAVHAVESCDPSAIVTGNVYLSDGVTPVDQASVVVLCGNASNEMEATTDALGEYDVEYCDAALCSNHDMVTVTATKDDMTGSNTGHVCSDHGQCPFNVAIVDVTIPEFGLVGAMIVLLAGIGIVAYRRH